MAVVRPRESRQVPPGTRRQDAHEQTWGARSPSHMLQVLEEMTGQSVAPLTATAAERQELNSLRDQHDALKKQKEKLKLDAIKRGALQDEKVEHEKEEAMPARCLLTPEGRMKPAQVQQLDRSLSLQLLSPRAYMQHSSSWLLLCHMTPVYVHHRGYTRSLTSRRTPVIRTRRSLAIDASSQQHEEALGCVGSSPWWAKATPPQATGPFQRCKIALTQSYSTLRLIPSSLRCVIRECIAILNSPAKFL